MTTPTRTDYMEKRVTFAEYYRAVARTAGVSMAHSNMLDTVRAALANGDEHLNSIPLVQWDRLAEMSKIRLAAAFKQHGDFYSLAGGVCVYKQAARDAGDAKGAL